MPNSLLYVKESNGIWRKRMASFDNYDPEFIERLVALFADSRIADFYFVNSGSRSYTKQVALYALYKAGGNLAAPPGTSNHEYGSKRHPLATAADINPFPGGSYGILHHVAWEYGFHFPILSELWHAEFRPGRGPLPLHAASTTTTFTEDDDMVQYEWADGAIVAVDPQGNAYCPEMDGRPTAKHFGGIPKLRPEFRQGFQRAVCVVGLDRNNSQAGYRIFDQRWSRNGFKFEPGVDKLF